MSRPRFSEILVTRRHELGLSTAQASRILKLKEDVLIAFEEGDWDHMPQSGYAQGMLSSYARYLGLNAREVTSLFQEDLYQHQHGNTSHELRRHTRDTQAGRGISGYEMVNEADSRPKAYVEYHGLLPTSGGPAGDMGDFATTSEVSSRQSVPLMGQTITPRPSYSHQQYVSGHPYNTSSANQRSSQQRAVSSSQGTARRRSSQAQQRRRYEDSTRSGSSDRSQYQGTGMSYGSRTDSQRAYRRDDVNTRRVTSSEYVDDMRYDDRETRSYERASTISGRRASRDIASTERPNVRRRSSQSNGGSGGARRSGNSSRRQPKRRGLVGALENFFSDSGSALFAIIVLLTVVLTAIIVFSMSSCTSGSSSSSSSSQTSTITVNTTTSDEDDGTEDTTSDDATSEDSTTEDSSATGEGTSEDTSDTESEDTTSEDASAAAATETVVEVSVAKGSYSWVEIECDGTIQVAEGITGTWSQSFTVTDSITVSANNPDVVTVTENGEKVDFTSKASGIGTVTVTAPQTDADEAAVTSGSDSTTTTVSA